MKKSVLVVFLIVGAIFITACIYKSAIINRELDPLRQEFILLAQNPESWDQEKNSIGQIKYVPRYKKGTIDRLVAKKNAFLKKNHAFVCFCTWEIISFFPHNKQVEELKPRISTSMLTICYWPFSSFQPIIN